MSRKLSVCFSFFAMVLILSGCQTTQVSGSKKNILSSEEITELFSDQTVESVGINTGITTFTYYDPNGTIVQERYWENRTGLWSVNEDNKICLQIGDGRKKCRAIVKENGSFLKQTDDRYYKYRLTGDEPLRVVRYRQFVDGNQLRTR